jgi:hypothetical protein
MYLGGSLTRKSALCRQFAPERLNELANHPEIRPTCGGDGSSELDFSAFVADPKNHAVTWDCGAFLFGWSAPQTYEVHIMVLPEGRGRSAYLKAREGIAYIERFGAERLWARVERGFAGLRHYVTHAGFTRCGADTLDIGFGPVAYDLYKWTKPCPQQS